MAAVDDPGKVPLVLGLGCALVLLAACGTSRTNTGTSSGGGGDDAGSGDAGSEGSTSEGGETGGMVEPTCTIENYEDHPDLASVWDVVCVPALGDGTCAECDLACAEELLPCENGSGGTLLGPPDLILGDCYDYAVLCSEQLGDECCHFITANQSIAIPGRPLRAGGKPVLPELCLEGESTRAGDRYRELARYEQASVGAFEVTADLLASLGAPARLVAAHRRSAREEAHHAELALAAAQDLDGARASLIDGEVPGPWDELGQFAADLVRDGCLGELVAATEAREALTRAEVLARPALRRFWSTVAEDEARHAELAWEVLEWLLARAPEIEGIVRAELRRGVEAGQVPDHLVDQAREVAKAA